VQDGSDVITDNSLQNLSFECVKSSVFPRIAFVAADFCVFWCSRIRTPLGDVVLIADSIEVKTAWLSDLQLCIEEANAASGC
jgi:hypothetical protein